MKSPFINGTQYELVVLRISDWDEQGRPSKAEIGYDDTSFRLDDPSKSNEFLTAFVPIFCIKSKRRDN